jgi:hypothetical protein
MSAFISSTKPASFCSPGLLRVTRRTIPMPPLNEDILYQSRRRRGTQPLDAYTNHRRSIAPGYSENRVKNCVKRYYDGVFSCCERQDLIVGRT